MHRVAGCDFDAEVVEGAAVAGVFNQHQFEWGFGDGEVGIAGFDFGRFGVEQLGVEPDGLVEVVDVVILSAGAGYVVVAVGRSSVIKGGTDKADVATVVEVADGQSDVIERRQRVAVFGLKPRQVGRQQ